MIWGSSAVSGGCVRLAMHEVRRATEHDVMSLATVLSRAFMLDPVALDLFPPSPGRTKRVERFFALQVRHTYLPRGEVLVLEDLSAVALVIWPDAPKQGLRDQLLSLQQLLLLRGRVSVAQELARVIAASRPTGPHAYLGTIATDPERQREGRASILIASILERCDARGLSCCLEASTLDNVRFYERFGFAHTSTIPTHEGGPVLYAMTREPSPKENARGTGS